MCIEIQSEWCIHSYETLSPPFLMFRRASRSVDKSRFVISNTLFNKTKKMIKKSLLTILLVWVVAFAHSQTRFGISGGYTLSNLIDSEGQTYNANGVQGKLSSQSGFYGGLFAENFLSEKVSIHYELNYALLGGMLEAHLKEQRAGFLSRINIHQLLIPVSVKYYLHPKWDVYAGPYLGIKLKTKLALSKYYGFNPSTKIDEFEDEVSRPVNDNMQPLSLGVFAGSEYKLSKRFSLNAKYNYGFTNMSTEKNDKLQIHFLQAGINYYFK